MKACACHEPHERRRVVLTGGPGAGKTAVLELIRQSFCGHVEVLPESAGIVFGGGFPGGERPAHRQAAQKAIFYVQRELEAAADAEHQAVVLCDRGTVDGAAYWPGPGDPDRAHVGATPAAVRCGSVARLPRHGGLRDRDAARRGAGVLSAPCRTAAEPDSAR